MRYTVRIILFCIVLCSFIPLIAGAAESVKLFIPSLQVKVPADIPAIPHAQYGVISKAQMQDVRAGQDVEISDVILPNASTIDLSLHAFSVFTPDAEFYAVTKAGTVSMPPPDISLYQGTVAGDDSSKVYLALGSKMISGYIITGGHHYEIGLIKADETTGITYQLFDDANIPKGLIQTSCARANTIVPSGVNYKTSDGQNGSDVILENDHTTMPVLAAQYSVPIAVDVDYEGYQFWNSDSTMVGQYIAQLFGAVSTVYQNEANTVINVSFLRVWETADEPFTVQPSGNGFDETAISEALGEEQTYWQNNMGSVSRATAMLITKKNMCGNPTFAACGLGYQEYNEGGVYHLGVLCNDAYAYAITCVSGNPSIPQVDESVAAHELGHNFGCHHTHSCFWVDSGYSPTPIDECAPAEDGNCFSGTQQSTGTIMSYCTVSDFTFGDIVGPWLKNHVVQNANIWKCITHALQITAVTSSIDFGAQPLRTPKDTTFTTFLTNTGSQTVTVSSMKITGPDSIDFSFASGGAPPSFNLAPGQKHAVKLQFSATANGDRTATINIVNTATTQPITIALHGIGGASGVTGGSSVPEQFTLDQNFPNPVFVGSSGYTTTIQYSLPHESVISLSVVDIYGRTVAQLASGVAPSGVHTAHFDVSRLISGTYYYKLQSVDGSLVRMLTIVK